MCVTHLSAVDSEVGEGEDAVYGGGVVENDESKAAGATSGAVFHH